MDQTPLPSSLSWQQEIHGELRSLLNIIVESVSRLTPGITMGSSTFAPIEACLKLSDYWAVVNELGEGAGEFRAGLSEHESFLLDLITTIYAAGLPRPMVPSSPDSRELWRLLAEAESITSSPRWVSDKPSSSR
jgi:hypothetical protein